MRKLLLAIAVVFICCLSATAQDAVINTICGTGTEGFYGDGGWDMDAGLSFPAGMVIDGAGNIIFCDAQNGRIRKIDTGGIITTVAGSGTFGSFDGDGGPATNAHLYNPQGVCMDATGNIYIADPGINVVRKVNTAGIISTFAGRAGIDSFGYNGDGIAATAAKLFGPFGVAADAAGNIYIADGGNSAIRKVNTAGIISTIAGDTTRGYSGDGGPATNAMLDMPFAVTTDTRGNVYFSEFAGNRIRKVNSAGIISTIAGGDTSGYRGDGGPATAALLFQPLGLKVDNTGNLYFADQGNNRVRKIDTAGIISLVAGTGLFDYTGDGSAAIDATFRFPADVALDAKGDLYVTDNENFVIRQVANPALGVQEVRVVQQPVVLFPDPATENITVRAPQGVQGGVLTICNVTGQAVNTARVNTASVDVDVSGLSAGVYFVSYNASGYRWNGRFVKE